MKVDLKKREITGKKVKNLRKEGIVPGSIYGPKRPSMSVMLSEKTLKNAFEKAGFSKFIDITIEGESKSVKALVKDLTVHPILDSIINFDFYQIDDDSKLTVDVPVILIGESPAVKLNKGFLVASKDTIKVHCLPKDLPEKFEISLETLEEPGNSVLISDIKLPEGVEFDASEDMGTALVLIQEPQKFEEVAATEETAETDSTEEAKTTEETAN